MDKQTKVSKIFALVGTILIFVPYVLMILMSLLHLLWNQEFQMDFLLPGELFPVIAIGIALLVWVAFRDHIHQISFVVCAMAVVVAFLFVAILPGVTGYGSVADPPMGYLVAVYIFFGLYFLFALACGVIGMMFMKSLFSAKNPKEETEE